MQAESLDKTGLCVPANLPELLIDDIQDTIYALTRRDMQMDDYQQAVENGERI